MPASAGVFLSAHQKTNPACFTDEHSHCKDYTQYKFPLRHGKRVMSHVHLPPELIAKEKADWEKADKHRSRKTSHNHLVYAGNATLNRYLLIYILVEPMGHDIAEMLTPDDVDLMQKLTDQAAEFLDTGNIYL